MKSVVCGIDLGTTNSVIAFLRNGVPEAVTIEEGTAILPSVVSFDEEGTARWVGRQAKNRRAAFPELTVASIKRQMGKDTTVSHR